MREILRSLSRDVKGNVAIIFGLTLVPLIFLAGMGVDYTAAVDRQVQLNAAADAAALAAVSPALMAQPQSASQQKALDVFNAQAAKVKGASYAAKDVTATVTTVNGKRQVQVQYLAASGNAFSNVLGMQTLAIAGSSKSVAAAAPNIDFYMLLDSSPSMAIAATQAGINKMVANTPTQNGCAFGCHQSNPGKDNLGNPGGIDNYQLARNLGVALRIDLVKQAASDLIGSAITSSGINGAKYRMATYTFDNAFNTIGALNANLPAAQALTGNIALLQTYSNNWLTSANNNSDTDTAYSVAINGINGKIPNPGLGTNNAGDTPQAVLFFVTDGVQDEKIGGNRVQSLMSNAMCTTIKNRGIRIAVLYTEYLPLPTNAWYNTYISPFQPNIGSNLQSCASNGLYTKVQTGGDISAALTGLFQLAVQTAYLAQ